MDKIIYIYMDIYIYMVYSQGPETLYNGIPKMYVTFFIPRVGIRRS